MLESAARDDFDARPLILTAQLDAATFALADGLRKAHFPVARNFLDAHLTLFHALPAQTLVAVSDVLAAESAAGAAMPLTLSHPFSLGFGVALAVQCDALVALRQRLRARWVDQLTAQDRSGWRPHITVQNKVPPAEARTLLAQLADGWRAVEGAVTGLALWRYDAGPWAAERVFAFGGGPCDDPAAGPAGRHS